MKHDARTHGVACHINTFGCRTDVHVVEGNTCSNVLRDHMDGAENIGIGHINMFVVHTAVVVDQSNMVGGHMGAVRGHNNMLGGHDNMFECHRDGLHAITTLCDTAILMWLYVIVTCWGGHMY